MQFVNEKEEHEHNDEFVGFELDELGKQFSTLTKELKTGGVNLDSVMEVNERATVEAPQFRDYIPTIMDYLKRANTVEECEEIISYCLNQKEISEDEAEELRTKLKRGGPKAFGTREPGFYNPEV